MQVSNIDLLVVCGVPNTNWLVFTIALFCRETSTQELYPVASNEPHSGGGIYFNQVSLQGSQPNTPLATSLAGGIPVSTEYDISEVELWTTDHVLAWLRANSLGDLCGMLATFEIVLQLSVIWWCSRLI